MLWTLLVAARDPLALLASRSSGDWGDVLPEDGASWRPFDADEGPPPFFFEEVRL